MENLAGQGLPSDSTLLPLRDGALLVSRSHATWCRIADPDLCDVRSLLAGETMSSALRPAVIRELERHGFFGPPRAPAPEAPSVQLQLTNACNLACAYCCTSSGAARQAELGQDEWFQLIDEIATAVPPRTTVGLLGGEPFLVPYAARLADRAVDLGLRAKLFTNGSLLAEGRIAGEAARLMARGVEVRVSLAGPTPELCDRVSGGVRFEQVVTGLHALHLRGATAPVDLMLLPQDVEAVASALPRLRAALPPGTRLSFGLVFRGGRETGPRVFPSRARLDEALDRIALLAGETIPAPRRAPVAPRREACTCALGHHLHVRSDGALYTCFRMQEPAGHLRDERFAAVYARVRSNPRPAAASPVCRACPLATVCGGGCRTDNFLVTGDADRPVCGPWRVEILCELLAEDRPDAVEWGVHQLAGEARLRGFVVPEDL